VFPVLERLRHRYRRQGRSTGRAYRRRTRAGGGRGQPRPPRPQGTLRLGCQCQPGPADPSAGPPRRPARPGKLGRGDGSDRPPYQGGEAALYRRFDRLLQLGPALRRRKLHARHDREGRHRHPAHGRQHPPVHGDGGHGAEGIVRGRRAARRLRGHRRHGLLSARRPRHGHDRYRAVGAGARPPAGGRAAPYGRDRPAPHGDDGRGGSSHPAAARHQRRRAERPDPAIDRTGLRRPRLHRRAHARLRRSGPHRGRLHARARRRDRAYPGGPAPPSRGHDRPLHDATSAGPAAASCR
jgi:hypothetical protein